MTMKLFAVRTIDGQQPVGFFWVRGLAQLSTAIDDICDPGICEYKPIQAPGAVVWTSRSQWRMGVENGADDPPSEERHRKLVRANIDFEGALDEYTCGLDVEGWAPMFPQEAICSDKPIHLNSPRVAPKGRR
jgi:hypothetical protein